MKKWWESPTAALGALCGEKAQQEADRQIEEKLRAEYQRGYEDGKESTVVHAHWVTDKLSGHSLCSACGSEADFSDYMESCASKLVEYPGNYCSNCGAKMDEED